MAYDVTLGFHYVEVVLVYPFFVRCFYGVLLFCHMLFYINLDDNVFSSHL